MKSGSSVRLFLVCAFLPLLSCLVARAGDAALAPAPPMGWNSWDAYGETITEAQVRANADWMAKPRGAWRSRLSTARLPMPG